jgi:cysteine desulfurase
VPMWKEAPPVPARKTRLREYHPSMRQPRVYLDFTATSPLLPAARDAMVALLNELVANPQSPHLEGRAAKDLLEAARTRVAKALGARPREVIFTSGATEACAIALRGAAYKAAPFGRKRIVISAVEYAAVLDTAAALEREGFEVTRVPVDQEGCVQAETFLASVSDDTAVAALMLANHEMGACMPVAEVAAALDERRIPLLVDAALGPGRLPSRVVEVGAPLIAYSAQKFGGPMGAGLLYVRRGTALEPWLQGGLQEERLRPGTENVVACVGLAAALEEALREQEAWRRRDDANTAVFLDGLADLEGWSLVGPASTGVPGCRRLPGLLTLELENVEGEAVMINMDLEGFSISTGSTCALGSSDPSPSLLAMGMSKQRTASTIRISVGANIGMDHMKRAASTLCAIVSRLRALARR